MKKTIVILLALLVTACSKSVSPEHQVAEEITKNFTYVSDPVGQDIWQHPDDTRLTMSGDCEDLAFLLWDELSKMGVDPDDMQLLEGKVMITGEQHLALRYENVIYDTMFVPDSLVKERVRDSFMIQRRWDTELSLATVNGLQRIGSIASGGH